MSSNNKKIIYCGNCGKRGHVYKKCFYPIMSLGIICFQLIGTSVTEDMFDDQMRKTPYNFSEPLDINPFIRDNLKFLLIRRKHTLGFIEFVRGNYEMDSFDDLDYLIQNFEIMTKVETEFIRNNGFDAIWNYLWYEKQATETHMIEYQVSKEKFEYLTHGFTLDGKVQYSLKSIVDNLDPKYDEPEWGFPKGRRNLRETDLDCANREFMEETNFSPNSYRMINIRPINELFTGSNHVNYKHTYYLGQYMEPETIPSIDGDNFFQKIEISDIQFFTYAEAMEHIRDYQVEKKLVLTKVYNLLHRALDKQMRPELDISSAVIKKPYKRYQHHHNDQIVQPD